MRGLEFLNRSILQHLALPVLRLATTFKQQKNDVVRGANEVKIDLYRVKCTWFSLARIHLLRLNVCSGLSLMSNNYAMDEKHFEARLHTQTHMIQNILCNAVLN